MELVTKSDCICLQAGRTRPLQTKYLNTSALSWVTQESLTLQTVRLNAGSKNRFVVGMCSLSNLTLGPKMSVNGRDHGTFDHGRCRPDASAKRITAVALLWLCPAGSKSSGS